MAFTMTPQVGFKGTVVLSCDGVPAGVTCTFAPPTLTSDGSGKVLTSTLTVATTGINGASFIWLPALAMLGLLGFRKRLKIGVLTVLLIAAMTGAVTMTTGCGSGILGGSTATGVNILTVKATTTAAGSSTVQTTAFILKITK